MVITQKKTTESIKVFLKYKSFYFSQTQTKNVFLFFKKTYIINIKMIQINNWNIMQKTTI